MTTNSPPLSAPSEPLADRVRRGDARALARAISLVEDEDSAGADLIRRLYSSTGRAQCIGVTGPPGAGKSTLVDRLITALRAQGRTIGVIAVDPTSPYSGGPFSATVYACKRTPETRACSSAAWRPADTSADWRARPATRRCSSMPPARTWS